MRIELQILIAVALDLAVGDPRWLPHPVRGIGRLALWFEALSRRALGSTQLAGVCASLSTYAAVGAAAWGAICLAAAIHPLAADLASVVVIYTTIAARDLARHSMAVFRRLAAGDIVDARRCAGAIVGRDTDRLDEAGVIRAAVESVAESTVDGVTAPLLFAVVAGPVGAMVYRAINTLDSMFGHQDDHYRQFGWAAARIDDLANWIPARCTAPLVCAAALLLRLRPRLALRTLLRDGRKHSSPNAGLTEAAMAGALGVRLGGVNYYDGRPLEKPTIGDAIVPLGRGHIRLANALMFVTAGLFLAVCLTVRIETIQLWHAWDCPDFRVRENGTVPFIACVEDCRMSQKPRILIFTGDGKGKTTAALGMAFRASGHGLRSCVVQFMKSDASVGEIAAAASTAIEIHLTGLGFVPPGEDSRFAQHRAAAQAGLRQATEALASGRFAIVILDEICGAVAHGLIDERQVVELLAQAPPDACLVLTGRDASPVLVALADTVTEMLCIKHGMHEGFAAQDGVER